MKRITKSWSLPCTVEEFWKIFLDPDYTRALYLEALQFKSYRVLTNEPAERKLHLSPKLNMPGPVAKLIGDSFAYEQHATIDRAQNLWTWKMVQPGDVKGKSGLVQSSGTIRVVDAGAGKCTRTDEVTVTANVFGLGGMIESAVEKELHSTWEKEITFFQKWHASHK